MEICVYLYKTSLFNDWRTTISMANKYFVTGNTRSFTKTIRPREMVHMHGTVEVFVNERISYMDNVSVS